MFLATNGIVQSGGTPLILDIYNGSAFAFSLRKLKSTATNSIRVRRSSDNAEQDIGFSGNDLDTSSLLSFVGSGNGFITTLYDQSGNNKNATQTTASYQAQIVTSGVVNTLNGKPSFTPVRGYSFTSTTISSLLTVSKSNTSSYCILVNGPSVFTALTYNNNYLLYYDGAFRTLFTVSNNTQYLTYQNNQSSKIFMSLNGTSSVDCGTAASSYSSSSLFAFSTNYNTNPIQEVIAFTTEQSSNESLLKTNINTYYGIY